MMFTSPPGDELLTPERSEQGYVIVLPGIEGKSFFNRSVVRGLVDAGLPYAIEIYDWTRGPWRMIANLRSRKRHQRQTQLLVEKIVQYRERFPGRPVYLIGHSGGGAMTLYVLQGLPEGVLATGAVLLGAAISPWFNPRPALKHVERAIWNVTSFGDFLFLGLFTTFFGSLDGCWGPCAGMTGFPHSGMTPEEDKKLVEMPFRCRYITDRDFAGHYGSTARPFVKKRIAPLLLPHEGEP